MRFRAFLAPLAALLLATVPWGTGCARTHRGLCEEQVRARCELAYRCCTDANERFAVLPAELTAYATSEGECIERLLPSCRAQDVLDDAAELGRVRLDQETAARCVDALIAARDACDVAAFDDAFDVDQAALLDDEEAVPCARASEGNVENGGTCGSSGECAPGGFCDFAFGEASFDDELSAFQGSCVSPGLAGEPCGAVGCADGLFCVRDACAVPPSTGEACPDFVCAAGNVCNAGGACEAFPAVGEPCEFQCAAGAFCEPSDVEGEPGTCTAQRAPGEACERFDECAGGETCLNGTCTGLEEAVCTG